MKYYVYNKLLKKYIKSDIISLIVEPNTEKDIKIMLENDTKSIIKSLQCKIDNSNIEVKIGGTLLSSSYTSIDDISFIYPGNKEVIVLSVKNTTAESQSANLRFKYDNDIFSISRDSYIGFDFNDDTNVNNGKVKYSYLITSNNTTITNSIILENSIAYLLVGRIFSDGIFFTTNGDKKIELKTNNGVIALSVTDSSNNEAIAYKDVVVDGLYDDQEKLFLVEVVDGKIYVYYNFNKIIDLSVDINEIGTINLFDENNSIIGAFDILILSNKNIPVSELRRIQWTY